MTVVLVTSVEEEARAAVTGEGVVGKEVLARMVQRWQR